MEVAGAQVVAHRRGEDPDGLELQQPGPGQRVGEAQVANVVQRLQRRRCAMGERGRVSRHRQRPANGRHEPAGTRGPTAPAPLVG
jgi:hypothetical protein